MERSHRGLALTLQCPGLPLAARPGLPPTPRRGPEVQGLEAGQQGCQGMALAGGRRCSFTASRMFLAHLPPSPAVGAFNGCVICQGPDL